MNISACKCEIFFRMDCSTFQIHVTIYKLYVIDTVVATTVLLLLSLLLL